MLAYVEVPALQTDVDFCRLGDLSQISRPVYLVCE